MTVVVKDAFTFETDMVDHSIALMTIYRETGFGGTAYDVEYARKVGKPIAVINPMRFAPRP